MAKLNKFFPGQPVASLSGDREFIGETWLHWLESQSIPFVLRLKENMFIWNEGYVPVKLSAHAQHLQKRQKRILKGTWYLGRDPEKPTTLIKIAMMRLKTGLWLARTKPPRRKIHGRLQQSIFTLGLNAFRKAMVKMSELEIVDYMAALFKPNIPRKPLIEVVL